MKTNRPIIMAILLLAMGSFVGRPAGAERTGTSAPAGLNKTEIPLVMGAKANGYTVKDLGSAGIEVTCQGVVAGPVKSEGKIGTAESEYSATATAGAKTEGSVSLGPERRPVEGVTASPTDKAGRSPGSDPKGGEAVTAPALVQGTVEVRAEAVAKGSARVSSGPSSLVSSGIATVSQKVEFKDGNATFRLCYANLKSITVVLGK